VTPLSVTLSHILRSRYRKVARLLRWATLLPVTLPHALRLRYYRSVMMLRWATPLFVTLLHPHRSTRCSVVRPLRRATPLFVTLLHPHRSTRCSAVRPLRRSTPCLSHSAPTQAEVLQRCENAQVCDGLATQVGDAAVCHTSHKLGLRCCSAADSPRGRSR
jgi:hypothetical protein